MTPPVAGESLCSSDCRSRQSQSTASATAVVDAGRAHADGQAAATHRASIGMSILIASLQAAEKFLRHSAPCVLPAGVRHLKGMGGLETKRPVRRLLAIAAALLALVSGANGASPDSWPSLLGPREAFPPDVSAAVERLWSEPTLRRTVNGRPARVPFAVYVTFLDMPEVTAAAARFRRIGSYEIQALGGDRYLASDGDGARGSAQV